MITIACCAFVGFFLIYCLDQIGAVDWLWEAVETFALLVGAFWPVMICGLMFGLGWELARHAA